MRDHYHGFSHPVLDLPPRAVTHLFAEFDQIASELRAHPKFVADDLQIAFCQLQKMRLPSLPRNEWLWLFGIWRDQDRAQQGIDGAKRDARYQELTDERELLFKVRERHPEQRAALTARLAKIGCELAELEPKFPAAPLGDWV